MQYYVIAYDICQPKRLRRVHRLMSDRALFLQKSVYGAPMSPQQKASLIDALLSIIKPEDDVRIYPTEPPEKFHYFGKQVWQNSDLRLL